MHFFLVNLFTISRSFIFLRRYKKTEGIEKGDKDKYKQYQKRRYDLFIFQKTEKNKINLIIVIIQSVIVTVKLHIIMSDLTLIFRKKWRICDLISIYYFSWRIVHVTRVLKSLANWRFLVRFDQTFVKEILVSYLWRFLLNYSFIRKSPIKVVR